MNILNIFMIVALVAVVGALGFGLFGLFKGGEFNEKYGNAAMRWRVMLQGLALLLFFLILYFGKH